MTERVQGLSYLQKLLAKFLTVLLTAKFGSKLGGNYCGCLHDGDTRSLQATGHQTGEELWSSLFL